MAERARVHRRRHTARRAVAVALTATVTVASLIAQERFTFYLSATTLTGERVTDLSPERITLTEDGRPGRVLDVVPIRRPVRVTVLLDNGFNTESLLVIYRNSLKALFAGLSAGVEASLVTLAPQPRILVRPTTDRSLLMKGVDSLTTDAAAPRTIDALFEASNRIEQENRKERSYFPVIVLVSTTGPEGSRAGDRDLQRMGERFNTYAVRLHVVMLANGGTTPNDSLGSHQVDVAKSLTDQSAGRYEAIAAPNRIPALLEEYAKTISEAHAFQSVQFLVTAERPAGTNGEPVQRAVGVSGPRLNFTVTPDGLIP